MHRFYFPQQIDKDFLVLKDKPIFQQKYAWIRDNVFRGKEFSGGDIGYKDYASDLYFPGSGIIDVSGFATLKPDFVWNYLIK